MLPTIWATARSSRLILYSSLCSIMSCNDYSSSERFGVVLVVTLITVCWAERVLSVVAHACYQPSLRSCAPAACFRNAAVSRVHALARSGLDFRGQAKRFYFSSEVEPLHSALVSP